MSKSADVRAFLYGWGAGLVLLAFQFVSAFAADYPPGWRYWAWVGCTLVAYTLVCGVLFEYIVRRPWKGRERDAEDRRQGRPGPGA